MQDPEHPDQKQSDHQWSRTERTLPESLSLADTIVRMADEPMVVLDQYLSVISASRAFYQTFGLNPSNTEQRFIYDLGNQWQHPKLRELYDGAKRGETHFQSFDVEFQLPEFGLRIMRLNARHSRRSDEMQILVLSIRDITEHRLQERALHESEEKFRILTEQSPDIICISNSSRILYVNHRCEKVLGYSVEEMCDFDYQNLIAPEFRDKLIQIQNMQLSDANTPPVELAVITKAGKKLQVIYRGNLVRYGETRAVLSVITDVSELKRAEEQVLQTNRRLEYLLSATDAVIYSSRGINGYENSFVSDNVSQVLGYEPTEIIHEPNFWFDHIHKEDQERILNQLLNLGVGTRSFEYRFRHKNGKYLWLLDDARTVLDKYGNPSEVVGCVLNVTRQRELQEALLKATNDLEQRVEARTRELVIANKKLEREILDHRMSLEALKAAQQNFQNSLDNSPLGIRIVTADGKLLYANQATLDIYGYANLEELRNTPARRRYTTESYLEHVKRKERRRSGKPVPNNYETSIIRKNGDVRRVAVARKEVIWNGKIQYQTLYQDITERELAQQRLHVLSRRLVEIQEAERRGIAMELHDQTIQYLALVKILLGDAAKDASKEGLQRLQEAQTALDEVVDQVREMSLNLRPTMLDDQGLLPTLEWHFERYYARTKIVVNFKHSGLDKPFPAEINTAAYRIIQEALSNVARHAGVKRATVRIRADKRIIRVSITDRGKGFDPARLAPASVGLSGMAERVFLLRGKLTIRSAPGSGTHITVDLPLSIPPKGKGIGSVSQQSLREPPKSPIAYEI